MSGRGAEDLSGTTRVSDPASSQSGEHQISASPLAELRLLFVDDDESMLSTQKRVLERVGLHVETVSSGEEAIRRAREQRFDAFLVDVKMEPHDGFWTCRELLAIDPDFVIIMLTGLESDEAHLAAIEAGATDYILKRTNFVVLGAIIRQRIRERRDRSHGLLRFGRLTADPASRAVFIDGERVNLPEEETALFWFLVSSPGKWYRAEEIHETLRLKGKSRSTQRALQRLRELLGECGTVIQVAKGRGYCFRPATI